MHTVKWALHDMEMMPSLWLHVYSCCPSFQAVSVSVDEWESQSFRCGVTVGAH